MKNLLRNTVRSFKTNKMSIIGLIFLLFFGLGAFCTLTNTTYNIKSEYTSISSKGNLHDFTASELYNIGSPGYMPKTAGISYDSDGSSTSNFKKLTVEEFMAVKNMSTESLYHSSDLPEKEGTYYVPLPSSEHFSNPEAKTETYVRKYNIRLDENLSSGLYKSYAKNKAETRFTNFVYKVTAVFNAEESEAKTRSKEYHDFITTATPSETQIEQAGKANIFADDYKEFVSFINARTQEVFSAMTVTDTPLSLYLKSESNPYRNDIETRSFKSLNVTATKDNIFYKIVDSNIEDKINKIVLFDDTNKRKGNTLYSINDWSPFDSDVVIYGLDGNILEPGKQLTSFKVPTDFNDVASLPLYSYSEIQSLGWKDEDKVAYSQIMQIRFKRMLAGDRGEYTKLDSTLTTLAATSKSPQAYYKDFYKSGSDVYQAYTNYYDTYYKAYGESVTISANGNVVYTWIETFGTPQTCTLSNWTGRLSVVNPQHLSANNKAVLHPSVLNDFEPFRKWYKAVYKSEPSSEISASKAKEWFNTLNTKQFAYWISPGDKSEMAYSIPGETEPLIIKTGTKAGQWNGINKKYIAECGGYNQVIWGCGITPDFMYPVVDISRPTPNVKTEALVYCNDAGYNSIKLAFINSPVEEYLLGKFKSGVSKSKQNEIINDINNWAKSNMIWPSGMKSAYFADDTSNVTNPSGFRVAYIPNLVKVVNVVSIVLSVFVAVLSLVICYIIIKRYVERNRINIGIMRANGISKGKIALSLFPFALIPAFVGGVAAYIVGLVLQPAMLKLFGNYWTLPTPLIGFNWITLILCILLPFLIFSLICFLATLVVLRTKAVELMKSGSEFKTNAFSRVVKKPFKGFGIMTRFRVSLAFNSISRLIMLTIMSCLTMASLVFAFTTFDKLNRSKSINASQFNYSFSLQLTTPTTSGSTYGAIDYSSLGMAAPTGDFLDQYIYNINWDTTADPSKPYWNERSYKELTRWYADGSNNPDIVGLNGNIMLPSASDMQGQNQDLMYLADKMCSKLTLDYSMGVSFAASNPWEIALALMPANSRNLANDAFKEVSNKIGTKVYLANAMFESLYPAEKPEDRTDEEKANTTVATVNKMMGGEWCCVERRGILLTGYYYVNPMIEFFDVIRDDKTGEITSFKINQHSWMTGFSDPFLKMIVSAYNDEDIIKTEYPIQYRNIPINWDIKDTSVKKDELYTYVNGLIVASNGKAGFDRTHEIKMEGIVEEEDKHSQYVNLTDKNGKSINHLIRNMVDEKNNIYPVIVNAYSAHKYKLSNGNRITIQLTNTADRFERKLHPEKFEQGSDYATFEVVGISQGTNGEAFYTNQRFANKALGLPDGESWNKTHRYMIWQDDYSATRQIVDLACVDSEDWTKVPRYSFTKDDTTVTQPVKDETITRKNYAIPVAFNGIYTANKSGKPLTNGISLYSYTGMYPGASVYSTKGSENKFKQILMNGVNLGIANKLSCIEDPDVYTACDQYVKGLMSQEQYEAVVNKFINKLVETYGDTTMVTAICGAMDVAASDLIYKNLIGTFNVAQTSIMAIIIPITIIIVGIISNLIITDSKKMAAMLKALGYSDRKNIMSILAMFVPTIIFGLILAIPLSFGLTLGYQALIFNGANILVDVTQRWYYYIGAVAGIGVILTASYIAGYASLKRDRLVDQIK